MLSIANLSDSEFKSALVNNLLTIHIGAFDVRVKSGLKQVRDNIRLLYSDYPFSLKNPYSDFQIEISTPSFLRKWIRPQVNFFNDDFAPFKPLPKSQAFALFEWGLNWCVATHAHQYLLIHAAIVSKNNQAIVLPGAPGSGKSTLCAALVNRGWTLLSDEMTIIETSSQLAIPAPRPVSLKNASIEIIKQFEPSSIFGSIAHDTAKGTVSHMKPPTESVKHAKNKHSIKAIIFPKYKANSPTTLSKEEKGKTLLYLAENSFNYHFHGLPGFELLSKLVSDAGCYNFEYSDLNEAIDCFNSL